MRRLVGVAWLLPVAVLVVLLAQSGWWGWVSAESDPLNFLPIIRRAERPPDTVHLEPFAVGLDPATVVTDIVSAGDDRLFVVERSGKIYVVLGDGTILTEPFLDISSIVTSSDLHWEEGLLSLVFHPNFALNRTFYVSYTTVDTIVIRRYAVSTTNPNKADPDSWMRVMARIKPTEYHHGGKLLFGPDGYLYIATGDGGPDPLDPSNPNAFPGDPENRGQRKDELYGSILRINIDDWVGDFEEDCTFDPGNDPLFDEYTIPPDNPYRDGKFGPACDEVWMTGLRNPWKISFDRATGDLWITDVGEWYYDEINFVPAGTGGGRNFGWHCYEGPLDYTTLWPEVAVDCGGTDYTLPDYAMPTNGPGVFECSLTGGHVYRGMAYPGLNGWYVYGDFCTGKIWRINATSGWVPFLMADTSVFISAFGEDADGELYVGGWKHGTIYKVVVP